MTTILHEGHKDYKSELQEYTQEKFGCVPSYVVVRERGPDHDKVFEVELTIRGQLQGIGTGKSKKEAEQAAARHVLDTFIHQEGRATGQLQTGYIDAKKSHNTCLPPRATAHNAED